MKKATEIMVNSEAFDCETICLWFGENKEDFEGVNLIYVYSKEPTYSQGYAVEESTAAECTYFGADLSGALELLQAKYQVDLKDEEVVAALKEFHLQILELEYGIAVK